MLIVCTRDLTVVQTAQSGASGANAWGALHVVPAVASQLQATQAIAAAIAQLGANEPLCFSAHGNDAEIGDDGSGPNDWSWTRAQIAMLLIQNAPAHYAGPILIHACAQDVSNFAAGLAVALGSIPALVGVWIYGYNRSVPSNGGFPAPNTLARQADLQGSQVTIPHLPIADAESPEPAPALPPAPAPTPTAGGTYGITFPNGCRLDLSTGFDLEEVRKLVALLAATVKP